MVVHYIARLSDKYYTYDMASPKKEFRCPQELLDAAEARATEKSLSFSDYIRDLIERDTGTNAEVKQGFQAFSKTALTKAHRAARKSRRLNMSDK